MSHSTTTSDYLNIPFASRVALVNYGLKELRRLLAGLLAIEQMLRPPGNIDPDVDEEVIDLFKADLAELLATVNTALSDKTDFLLQLAEANQQELVR